MNNSMKQPGNLSISMFTRSGVTRGTFVYFTEYYMILYRTLEIHSQVLVALKMKVVFHVRDHEAARNSWRRSQRGSAVIVFGFGDSWAKSTTDRHDEGRAIPGPLAGSKKSGLEATTK